MNLDPQIILTHNFKHPWTTPSISGTPPTPTTPATPHISFSTRKAPYSSSPCTKTLPQTPLRTPVHRSSTTIRPPMRVRTDWCGLRAWAGWLLLEWAGIIGQGRSRKGGGRKSNPVPTTTTRSTSTPLSGSSSPSLLPKTLPPLQR